MDSKVGATEAASSVTKVSAATTMDATTSSCYRRNYNHLIHDINNNCSYEHRHNSTLPKDATAARKVGLPLCLVVRHYCVAYVAYMHINIIP